MPANVTKDRPTPVRGAFAPQIARISQTRKGAADLRPALRAFVLQKLHRSFCRDKPDKQNFTVGML